MTTDNTADIIVVGDGLAALALLCSLRRSSLRILVLSHGLKRQPDNRGLALSQSSKRILDNWGVWKDLADSCQPIEQIRVSEQNHSDTVWLQTTDINQPALGYVVPAEALYAGLSRAAEATPRRLIKHREIRELCATDDKIRVLSDTTDQQLKLSAKLLVAADGAHSTTSHLAGAIIKTSDYHQTAIITDIADTRPHNNTAYEHFTRNGPVAILPLPANRRKLVLTVDSAKAESVLNLPEKEFLNHFAICPGIQCADWHDMGRRAARRLWKKRTIADQAQGRWLAIGDAAHIMHPTAAQGFNLCLRDIACLEKHLSAPEAGLLGDKQWLSAYHDQRRQDQAATALLADGLALLYHSDHAIPRVLRHLGMAAVNHITPLRQRLMRQATGMAPGSALDSALDSAPY